MKQQKITIKTKTNVINKNYGIELLRIVSTLMIITLHVLGQGGILYGTKPLTIRNEIIWFLEIASYCCINCFGLISGYVGGKKYHYEQIITLWLKIFIYETLINVVFCFINSTKYLNIENIKNNIFFLTRNSYWYFTAYFILFLFIPYLEKIIEYTNEKEQKKLAIIFFVFFSIIPTFISKNLFSLANGYSFVWLATLYLIGGFIRKNNWFHNLDKKICIIFYFSNVFFTWITKFIVEFIKINICNINEEKFTRFELLISYLSPTILLSGIFLFLFFVKLNDRIIKNEQEEILIQNKKKKKKDNFILLKIGRIKITKIITMFSSCSFGIYILHTHPLVWNNIIINKFIYLINKPLFIMLIGIFTNIFVIYFICFLVEKVIGQCVLNYIILNIKKIFNIKNNIKISQEQ